MPQKSLVLASTSPYRRSLLDRLGLSYSVIAPEVDETPEPNEQPALLAARLAARKATVKDPPGNLVIGSDQVASLDGQPLGKPGSHAAALAQLERCQGRVVIFHTAVAIHCTETVELAEHVDITRVRFASRPVADLDNYLKREPAYDCAGGFKVEGLGVTLFDYVESKDPSALIGLPLIWVARTLREFGLDPLRSPTGP